MTSASRPPLAPGARPVVGHSIDFLRDPLGSLDGWGQAEEPIVRLRIAGRSVCLVTDPSAVQRVLATDAADYRKAEIVRERLGTLQGGSLVLLEGEAWRERRQLLQTGFTSEHVAAMGSHTTEYATEMVDSWPTDRPVALAEHARDLSLALLARALFGLDLRGQDTPIHEAADDILARMDMQSVSTYLPEWVPTPTNRRFRRAVATLHDRLDETVARRAAADQPGTDLLATMLAADLPPETVRDELIAFLFAGFDSTATALACTLGLLAEHPDVQARLHRELDTQLDGRTPTPADLQELPTLDGIVRESLRLYPPQYLLFREPRTAVTLGGYRVDPGTIVVLPPWVLHRDERFWDDPSAFRPGRWLDSEGGRADRTGPEYAYVPYGGGQRYCLGARLADQVLRLVVAVVCQSRRLNLVGSLSVSAGPTLSVDEELAVDAPQRE
ncbi:cytochrome P450 [Halomicroarcula sp. F28]|uniref:cytochrome P450 n=1 Tax=Haloarcula salinisoli TaxID=2487746 RepID=UPI001C73160D|nr:cytochrome P450 [Halomicroarcula salinisoli]MBX0288295.1 cytochrome P450 [Halomicroarcula salinisoli]